MAAKNDGASPATENHGGNSIPQARFNDVVKERNELRQALARANQNIVDLAKGPQQPEPTTAPPATLPTPPEGMDKQQAAAWQITELIKQVLPNQLKQAGLDPDQLAELTRAAPQIQQESVQMRWARMCQERGLNPTDQNLQDLVMGRANRAGTPLDEVLDQVKDDPRFASSEKQDAPEGAASTEANVAMVDSSTQKPIPKIANTVPTSKDEAHAMAKRGEKAPFKSVTDILGDPVRLKPSDKIANPS